MSLVVPGDPNKPGKVPESHVLVEKIVKLQKTLAKKQEKVEFMEEHISTMLEEIKKKNKLIQNYILKLESGALVSSQMDENKVCAKFTVEYLSTKLILSRSFIAKDISDSNIYSMVTLRCICIKNVVSNKNN